MNESLDDIVGEALLDKHERWLKERSGLATASQMPNLSKSGRNKEKEPWGKVAITELYGIKYERRTGLTLDNVECKAFEFGHEHEPAGLEAMRKKYRFAAVKSCSEDYDEIIFKKPFEGCGDSPDANIYNSKGKVVGVAEVKCNISQTKFEKLRDITVIDNKHEYYWQFIMHLIGTPEAKFLIWANYDAYNDQIHCVRMWRKDVEADITWLTQRIKDGIHYIDLCLKKPKKYKLSDINEYYAKKLDITK